MSLKFVRNNSPGQEGQEGALWATNVKEPNLYMQYSPISIGIEGRLSTMLCLLLLLSSINLFFFCELYKSYFKKKNNKRVYFSFSIK